VVRAPEALPIPAALAAEAFLVACLDEVFSAGFCAAARARAERAPAFLVLPFRGEVLFAALFLTEALLAELLRAAPFLTDCFFAEVFFAAAFLAGVLGPDVFFLDAAFVADFLRAELVFRAPLGFAAAFRFLEVLGALDLRVGFFAGLMGAGR
jgi:hypothetical protein